MEYTSRAQDLCEEADSLKTEMSTMSAYWQDAATHAAPMRRLGFTKAGSSYAPDTSLRSDAAADALRTLATGMLSWVTPSSEQWFQWKPAEGVGGEAAAWWLSDCTARAHDALSHSNFYNAIHLAFADLGAFGTVGLLGREGKDSPLHFDVWHTGTFACAENIDGVVERGFRFQNMTSAQAVDRFGPKAPAKCKEEAADAKRKHNRHEFINAIVPRDHKERDKMGPRAMPWASYWLYPLEKTIVAESGFPSRPLMISRWIKFSDDSPWGVSPAMMSIADIRGNNYLEGMMAAVAELKVNPRILAQTGQIGDVNLAAGGVTMINDMTRAPQIWADPSDYKIGMDLIERVDRRIERAFHVPLFEQFSRLEREITATEARYRAAEQLARVSPAFTLQTTDLINPLLERVFMIMLEKNLFAEPPPEMLTVDSSGQRRLFYPQTIQTNRMSRAIEQMKEGAFAGTMEMFFPFFEIQPSLLNEINMPVAMREIARGKGVPQGFLRAPEEVEAINQAQAQQAAQQQALEFASKQPEMAAQVAGAAMGG